jgi:hypothetical protein
MMDDIRNDTARFQQISSNANQWKKERAYSVLGCKLKNNLIAKYRYFGSDEKLPTQVGRRDGLKLFTTGVSGCLLHGPYIELEAGVHQIIIRGARRDRAKGASVEIATNNGQKVITKSPMGTGDIDFKLACFHFTLDEPCRDVEVRVWVNDDTDLHISEIEFEPSTTMCRGQVA